MAGDWLEQFFDSEDERQKEAREKRVLEIQRHKKLVGLLLSSWNTLRNILKGRVDAYNAKVGPEDALVISENSGNKFSVRRPQAKAPNLKVEVSPDQETLTISYDPPLPHDGEIMHVRLNNDSSAVYLEGVLDAKNLPFNEADKYILLPFFKSARKTAEAHSA